MYISDWFFLHFISVHLWTRQKENITATTFNPLVMIFNMCYEKINLSGYKKRNKRSYVWKPLQISIIHAIFISLTWCVFVFKCISVYIYIKKLSGIIWPSEWLRIGLIVEWELQLFSFSNEYLVQSTWI